MTIEEIAGNKKEIVLMDNNVLASDFGLQQIEQAIKLNLKLDFNQGLDARLIDRPMAKLLSRVKWLYYLRMACDNKQMIPQIERATKLLREENCKPTHYFVYVLLKELQDSYERVKFCKNLELKPFAQPFRDFTSNQIIPQWQKDMAHYTNKKSILYSIDFKDFIPRKGFICKKYF